MPYLNQCGHIRHRVKRRLDPRTRADSERTYVAATLMQPGKMVAIMVTTSVVSPNNEADQNNAKGNTGGIGLAGYEECINSQSNRTVYLTNRSILQLCLHFSVQTVHLQSSNNKTSHREQKRTQSKKTHRSFQSISHEDMNRPDSFHPPIPT